jgi:hypothetical protein
MGYSDPHVRSIVIITHGRLRIFVTRSHLSLAIAKSLNQSSRDVQRELPYSGVVSHRRTILLRGLGVQVIRGYTSYYANSPRADPL